MLSRAYFGCGGPIPALSARPKVQATGRQAVHRGRCPTWRLSPAVIPSNASRARAIPYDKHLYEERHLVELLIKKIKHFRCVATRYDKTIASYASFVAIAGFLVWMR
jgi:transposase